MLADLREADLAGRLQDGESTWEIRRELRIRQEAARARMNPERHAAITAAVEALASLSRAADGEVSA